ncbi:MAG: single-stranded DNA exonuclease RecJ, partial [Synergistaceae bacterium]|nr:single-stranded DNA exonuclease RecJ [Synergistaceae bacterium]
SRSAFSAGRDEGVLGADDWTVAQCPTCESSLEEMMDDLYLGENSQDAAYRWRKPGSLGRVLVYGDYDADGASSTALALELCRGRAKQARFFIPHRHEHGYGLHEHILDRLVQVGWDTLIVVDCGTKDYDLLERVARSGMNVFVFDHHLPDPEKPLHSSVVNPHAGGGDGEGVRDGRALCATGVLWAWAWKHGLLPRERLLKMLDLVALATIADCMPLTQLNRALVRRGMDSLSHSPRPGLAKLFNRLRIETSGGALNEETLSMKIIPCINAAGRMEVADTAVEVLLGAAGMDESVDMLISLNRKRQSLSMQITEDAAERMVAGAANVILGESWPVGVLSGVASRICSSTGTPVALAAPVRTGIRGTLRVPDGGDAVGVLESLSSMLDAWGGHRYAAGFSVSRENWSLVERDLQRALASMKIEEPTVSAIAMDPGKISIDDWKEACRLGPFGNGNPSPLFFLRRAGAERMLPLGRDGKHLQIEAAGVRLLAFYGESDREALAGADGWVYRPRLDCWRGEERLQYIVDFAVV